MTVDFNINHFVLVKLTDFGRTCLRNNNDKLNLPSDYTPPKEDSDGWSRWQLWELMWSLGPHISHGMNPPFETTIRIELRKIQ